CSFCSRAETEVRKIIYKSDIAICDECVEICQTILSIETAKRNRLGWDAWASTAKTTEIQILKKAVIGFVGSRKDKILKTLGKPDRITGGGQQVGGKVKYKIEKRFLYSSLTPHARVIFGISGDKVREVAIFPKCST